MITTRTVDRGSAKRFAVYTREGIGRIIPEYASMSGTGPEQYLLCAWRQPTWLL